MYLMGDPGKSTEFRNSRSDVAIPREAVFFQDRSLRYGYLCVLKYQKP